MIKKYRISLIGFAFVALSSCESCETCDMGDFEIGELLLEEETLATLPYTGKERMVFVNEAGEERTFRSLRGWETNEEKFIDEIICSSRGIFPMTNFSYYKSQFKRLDYQAENSAEIISLFLRIRSTDIQNEFIGTDQLFDGLNVSMHRLNTNYGNIEFVWNKRNNPIEASNLSFLFQDQNYTADTTLLERNFEEVYWEKLQEMEDGMFTSLFFNRQVGIVAYVDYRYVLWVLDRIE